MPALVTRLTPRSAALLGAATLLAAFAGPPAAAVPATKRPKPPSHMSSVGGSLLARPGAQVQPRAGAPKLPKHLSALSWMVTDADTGQVLAADDAHWRLAPASTLKMLFADTVLPKFRSTEVYKVKPSDLSGIGAGSSLVGIKENLTYTVADLWRGVFLRSGNDAVHVLAAMNGGVPATVREMNAKAKALGADDTHVVTPDGYDEPGQHSSAYDLTLFARAGLANKDFARYCDTRFAQFPGDFKRDKHGKIVKKHGKAVRDSFAIQNEDRLLGVYQGLVGVKNGYTTHAGNTFVGAARRGGHTLLVAVMHPTSNAHNEVYKETAALLDWGFAADGKVTPVGELADPAASPSARTSASASPAAATSAVAAPVTRQAAAHSSSGTPWLALEIAGGVVVLAGGYVALTHRSRRGRHAH